MSNGVAPDGYLGDGRLGLNFVRIGRIDPKYFGRWEIDFGQGAKNGENTREHLFGRREFGRNKSGRWKIETPPLGASMISFSKIYTPLHVVDPSIINEIF